MTTIAQKITIEFDRCVACGECFKICPVDVFRLDAAGRPVVAYEKDCCFCFLCETHCPARCIVVSDFAVSTRFRSVYDEAGVSVDLPLDENAQQT